MRCAGSWRPRPSRTPRSSRPRRTRALLPGTLAFSLALVGGLATAAPAIALEDPTRPSGRVVHGPNCVDGYLRIEITNGTRPHTVTIGYDGTAAGPATELAAGGETTLEGTEIDWGRTVDVAVAVTGSEGDEPPLTFSAYTRPTEEDCAAVTPPPTTAPPTTSSPTATAPPSSTAPTTPPSSAPAPVPPVPTGPAATTGGPSRPAPRPVPQLPVPQPPVSEVPAPAPPAAAPVRVVPVVGSVSSGQVSPGSVITVRGQGFTPGERVVVSLVRTGIALATVTADEQGRIEAVVQIPQDSVPGRATVQLLGRDSAQATGVVLQVAAAQTPQDQQRRSWPLVLAGLVLLGVATGLGVAASRCPRRAARTLPSAG